MALLAIQDLSFAYPLCPQKALENISFSLEKGDFCVLCGATGSGKSTLLRCLKREIAPKGELSGQILYQDQPLSALCERESACRIGFVAQRPQQQIVADKVWHELAFGLENMGLPQAVIRRRVAETACFFGIEDWFDRDVSTLSGGQQQLLCLAAVMVMQPDILLLDEPTAQLDPIAAGNFLSTLQRLNRELALTILLIEHRLEEAIPLANKLLAIDDGRLIANDAVRPAVRALQGHPALSSAMPVAARVAGMWQLPDCPLTVQEGRRMLENQPLRKNMPVFGTESALNTPPALEMRDVFFRYERNLPDVLRGLSLTVRTGEIFCLLGGNGSGKSTALACAAKLLRPYAGTISVFGKKLKNYAGQSLYQNCLALLPQDVQTLFLCSTVAEELQSVHADTANFPMDFTPLLNRHPYDLSGGEQQALALCKALAARPRLLLLDEPTKGLDACARERMTALLQALRAQGLTVLCVTHDVAFAAACADRCALFFRGEVVSCGEPHAFFAGNHYYTTAANRMARGVCDTAICAEEVAALRRPPEAQP